jgi:hypothetical protein
MSLAAVSSYIFNENMEMIFKVLYVVTISINTITADVATDVAHITGAVTTTDIGRIRLFRI